LFPQTSLLGSILSNCLLVLGMAFLLGGLKNKVQTYNQKGAHMLSSLLLLASIALVLPAAFVNSLQPHPSMAHLLRISRVTALLTFVIYILYLYFQLYTHSEMFDDEGRVEVQAAAVAKLNAQPPPVDGKKHHFPGLHRGNVNGMDGAHQSGYQASSRAAASSAAGGDRDVSDSDVEEVAVEAVSDHLTQLGDLTMTPQGQRRAVPAAIKEETGGSHSSSHSERFDNDTDDEEEEEFEGEDEPQLTFACAIILLLVVTLAVAACSEYLVDSINEVTESWGMNESFVGVILLPIVGNAAEVRSNTDRGAGAARNRAGW